MISNRRASYNYELLESFEAGIVLTGSEVKSLRQGGSTISEAFAQIRNNELWLEGMHIPKYQQASYNNHEPLRRRKLLLHKHQIKDIRKGIERKGLTLVPTKLYFKDGWAKVTIALARGKKKYDKRQAEAKREAKREMEKVLK